MNTPVMSHIADGDCRSGDTEHERPDLDLNQEPTDKEAAGKHVVFSYFPCDSLHYIDHQADCN